MSLATAALDRYAALPIDPGMAFGRYRAFARMAFDQRLRAAETPEAMHDIIDAALSDGIITDAEHDRLTEQLELFEAQQRATEAELQAGYAERAMAEGASELGQRLAGDALRKVDEARRLSGTLRE